METAGYLAAILVGFSLGLIGGGGSILTVPVLVYLFKVDAVLATVYSLFIVGATSVVGSVSYFLKGMVDLRTATVFGLPSIVAVFATRSFILPVIPAEIVTFGSFVVTKNMLLMLLFAVLMVFASYSMIRKDRKNLGGTTQAKAFNYPMILLQGAAVGTLTGLIGAGGGFLIIPALVNFLKIPVKTAIGTSLVIIAANSLAGFLFSLVGNSIGWKFLLTVTLIAIAGILAGSYVSTKVDGKKLKPAFGWFVLVMGLYIILRETMLK